MSLPASISVFLALPLFIVVFAGVAVLAHSLLRRYLSPERLSEHHEVAGFLMGVVGVLYSVVLGFLVGTVWTSFSTAQQTSDLEAGYVADAFNVAGQLRQPQRAQMQRVIADYAIDVADTAWWAQSSHQGADQVLLNQGLLILTTIPGRAQKLTDTDVLRSVAIRGSLLDSFRKIADSRRLRLVQSRSRLPAGMLYALLLGALFVIAFTFFFGVRSYAKQMTMTALLAGSIGLFIGLVVVLSTPYTGPVQVSRDAWNFVIDVNHMRDHAK